MGRVLKSRDQESTTSTSNRKIVAASEQALPDTVRKKIYKRAVLETSIGLRTDLADLKLAEDILSPTTVPSVGDIKIQAIRAHALETFGSAKKAEHWMNRPNPQFQGKRPKEVIES